MSGEIRNLRRVAEMVKGFTPNASVWTHFGTSTVLDEDTRLSFRVDPTSFWDHEQMAVADLLGLVGALAGLDDSAEFIDIGSFEVNHDGGWTEIEIISRVAPQKRSQAKGRAIIAQGVQA